MTPFGPSTTTGGRTPVWGVAAGYLLLAALVVGPVVIKSYADWKALGSSSAGVAAMLVLGVTVVGGVPWWWRTIIRRFDTRALVTASVIAALMVGTSYASQVVGYGIGAVLGPFYVFIDGVGSKGVMCFLLGVLVTLIPRPGALSLAMLTVFTINGILSGTFGVVSLAFILASVAIYEFFAAALGATSTDLLRRPRDLSRPPLAAIVRTGLALGLSAGCSLLTQYLVYMRLFHLEFDAWYVAAVSLVTGVLYGSVGGGLGALVGLRFRRALV